MPSRDDAQIIYTGPSPRGWHRLQMAAECLQKYAWSHEAPAREKGKPSQALAKGSLVHLALAHHYARMRAQQQGEDPDVWCDPEEAVELIAKLEGTEQYVADVLSTYDHYVNTYASDIDKLRIIDIESLCSTYVRGKYLFTGRVDLSVEGLDGRIYTWDHKTTSRLQAAHKQFYAVSGQLIGYGFLAREKYGERYGGMKLNLIEHGGRFERIDLPRSPHMESFFAQTVVDIEEAIERMQASGRHYSDWPKGMNEMTCYGRYGACPFIDQCRFGEGAKKGGNWKWGGQ